MTEMKKKISVGLIVFAIVIIIAELILIDYSNLSWSKNLGKYLVILAMICEIFVANLTIRYDKKQQAKLTENE